MDQSRKEEKSTIEISISALDAEHFLTADREALAEEEKYDGYYVSYIRFLLQKSR